MTGKIVYNTPFNSKMSDTKLKQKIDTLSYQYYLDIQKQRKHPIQSLVHNVIFNVGIKSFVKNKGDKYQGVLDKYLYLTSNQKWLSS